MRLIYKLLLPLLVFLVACSSNEEKAQFQEVRSIIPKHKYALLIVESKSCIYCAQLKKDLRTEKILKDALKGMDLYTLLYESYKPVKTNLGGKIQILSEKELARKLGATSFPNLIFYDKEGNLILQIPGYLPPEKFACVINYVKTEEFKRQKLEDYVKKCA